jgi:hypothetical protein
MYVDGISNTFDFVRKHNRIPHTKTVVSSSTVLVTPSVGNGVTILRASITRNQSVTSRVLLHLNYYYNNYCYYYYQLLLLFTFITIKAKY